MQVHSDYTTARQSRNHLDARGTRALHNSRRIFATNNQTRRS